MNRKCFSQRHYGPWPAGAYLVLTFGSLLLATAAGSGCGGDRDSRQDGRSQSRGLQAIGISGDELFRVAMENLEHVEEYHSGEMLVQVVERLNQWIRTEDPIPGWKPDPMLDSLPQALRAIPEVQDVGELEFRREDGLRLQTATWIRDIVRWSRGESRDELSQARKLFDWTVRNVQLQPAPARADDPLARVRRVPWETLMLGEGSPTDRAWVFILLARELGIDAGVIGLVEAGDGSDDRVNTWAVGVRIGEDVFVFDAALGLPIPGPGGVRLGPDGQLDVAPATLRQLGDAPALLRRLDLSPDRIYPVKSEDLAGAVVLLEASPSELSMRMQMVEDRLTGRERMVLTAHPSQAAEAWKAVEGLQPARLWTWPFLTVYQRLELRSNPEFERRQAVAFAPFEIGRNKSLYRGRIAHLRGRLTGEEGASRLYQQARPSGAELNAALADGVVRRLEGDLYLIAKHHASYWLGLVCFELANYPAAIDYFATRTREALPEGLNPWKYGTQYNLARSLEAKGDYARAIQTYQSDAEAPGYHGNALRARWLRELTTGDAHGPEAAAARAAATRSAAPSKTGKDEPAASTGASPAEPGNPVDEGSD